MKVEYELNDLKRLILTVLKKVFLSIPYHDLKLILRNINNKETDIDQYFQDYMLTLSKNKSEYELINNLIDLRRIGLVWYRDDEYIEKLKRDADFSKLPVEDSKSKYRFSEDFYGKLISLTEEGKRIAESVVSGRIPILKPAPQKQTSIFLACAFGHDDIDRLSSVCLEAACQKIGLKPIRVDKTEPEQSITSKIMEEITKSKMIIADLTHARPSVYYEIGYAYGLGMKVILTCRKDHFQSSNDNLKVHFDIEQHKISFWEEKNPGEFVWAKDMDPFERLSQII